MRSFFVYSVTKSMCYFLAFAAAALAATGCGQKNAQTEVQSGSNGWEDGIPILEGNITIGNYPCKKYKDSKHDRYIRCDADLTDDLENRKSMSCYVWFNDKLFTQDILSTENSGPLQMKKIKHVPLTLIPFIGRITEQDAINAMKKHCTPVTDNGITYAIPFKW